MYLRKILRKTAAFGLAAGIILQMLSVGVYADTDNELVDGQVEVMAVTEKTDTSSDTSEADEVKADSTEAAEAADDGTTGSDDTAEAEDTAETDAEAETSEADADEDTEATGETSEAAETDKKTAAIEKKWKNKVMVAVDDHLNVRKKASTDSDIIGKMFPTSVAKVIKRGDEWTKIKSGNVKGYIKTSYCLFGMDAYKNMKKVCFKAATVTSSTLNIRSKATSSSNILQTVVKGTQLQYLKKSNDEWTKVKNGDVTGYVFSKYVEIGYNTTEALTVEEVKGQERTQASSGEYIYPATDDDIDLLAAIIYCEAGSEPYDGKVAVAAVVLNRVKCPSYSGTIHDVIYEPYQFGPARSGALSRTLANGSASSECYRAAKEALTGVDPTGGLLHFNRNNGSGVLVIGHHMFY